MASRRKAQRKRRGPRPVAEQDRRIGYTTRLPRWLVEAFRDACGDKRGEQTRVVEKAIERYVKRHRGGG